MAVTIRTPVAAPTWLQDYNRAVEREIERRLRQRTRRAKIRFLTDG